MPNDDCIKYSTMAEKLDWTLIKVGSFSPNACKEEWQRISTKVRTIELYSMNMCRVASAQCCYGFIDEFVDEILIVVSSYILRHFYSSNETKLIILGTHIFYVPVFNIELDQKKRKQKFIP